MICFYRLDFGLQVTIQNLEHVTQLSCIPAHQAIVDVCQSQKAAQSIATMFTAVLSQTLSVSVTEQVHTYVLNNMVCITIICYDSMVAITTTAGVLCGECRDRKGVSALLSRCTTCSSSNGVLIALLCTFT